jgi:hypothetical protein
MGPIIQISLTGHYPSATDTPQVRVLIRMLRPANLVSLLTQMSLWVRGSSLMSINVAPHTFLILIGSYQHINNLVSTSYSLFMYYVLYFVRNVCSTAYSVTRSEICPLSLP